MSEATSNLVSTVRRATWTVAACQVASQLISIAVLAVLYRLLPPGVFGIIAMATPPLLLARLLGSWGLGIASVQDPSLTNEEQAALFFRGLKLAVVAAILLLPCGWVVGWYYQNREAGIVLGALSLTLLMIALATQHQARLERKLALTRLAICRLAAQAIGGAAAITFASFSKSVWALVLQQYAEFGSLALLMWLLEPWRPRWQDATQGSTKRLVRFGGSYTASSLMFWLAQNADTLLIGRLAGDRVLGLYSQAFNLMMKPVLLVTTPVTSVMLPALARAVVVPDEFRRLMMGFFRLVGLLLLPCGVGLFIVASDVMLLLGGPAWSDSGPILRMLAPVILAQGFINIAGSVFASVGRADRLFYASILIALLLCQGIAAGWWLGAHFGGTHLAGAWGVATSYSAVTLGVILVPYLWYCCATVKLPIRAVVAELQRPALGAAVMGGVVAVTHGAMTATPAVRLAVAIPLGIIVYSIVMWREIRQTVLGEFATTGQNNTRQDNNAPASDV